MIALMAVDALAAGLFAGLYGVAGARLIPQPMFVASLPVLLVAMILFWMSVESRHATREPLARVGRAGAALAILLVVGPIVVLLPVFGLETVVPPDARDVLHGGPVMALVLIGAAWAALVNLAGGALLGVLAVARRLRGRRPV